MRIQLVTAALLFIGIATGCEGPVVPRVGPRIVAFTVDSPVLEFAETEVELSWEVRDAEFVNIDGLEGELPPRGTLRTRVDADRTFTLIARGRGEARAQQTVRIETVDIEGVVLDITDVPQAGLEVTIDDAGTVTTDEAGRFTLRGVRRPYSVRIVEIPTGDILIHIWDHLTVRSPKLRTLNRAWPPFTNYRLRYGWTNGIDFVGNDGTTRLYVFSEADDEQGEDTAVPWSSPREKGIALFGERNPVVDLLLMQEVRSGPLNDSTMSYLRYAHIPSVQLKEGEVVDLGIIELLPLNTRTVDVRLLAGEWLSNGQAGPSLSIGGGLEHMLRHRKTGSANAVNLHLPDLPEPFTFRVFAGGSGLGWPPPPGTFRPVTSSTYGVGLPRDQTVLEVDLLEPVDLVSPEPNGVVSATGGIEWRSVVPFCVVDLWTAAGHILIHTDRNRLETSRLDNWGAQTWMAGSAVVECYEGFVSTDEVVSSSRFFLPVRQWPDDTRIIGSEGHEFQAGPR